MAAEDDHRTWTRAFQEELEEIRRRGSSAVDSANLVGLALSGGGVRSATFGLGVLEALKDRGLLKQVHYLSTVSGGGFIGAWLSASCSRHHDWTDPATEWAQSVAHLRRYSESGSTGDLTTGALIGAFIGSDSAQDDRAGADRDAESLSITRLEGSRWRGGRAMELQVGALMAFVSVGNT